MCLNLKGWKSSYDEKVSQADAFRRFKELTPESAEHAKEQLKKAQEAEFGKKRKSTTLTRTEDGASRGSTSG